MQTDTTIYKLLVQSGNLKLLWELAGGAIFPVNDIADIGWCAESGIIDISSSGTDPIVCLPHMEFNPAIHYFVHIDGESADPLWQIFYITAPNQTHSGERMVTMNFSGKDVSDGLWIELPVGLIPQRLRLDPGALPGKIRISRLALYRFDPAFENHGEHRTSPIYLRCQGMDSASWTSLLKLSVSQPRIGDMVFPGFPAPDIQTGMVGSNGENTIDEMGKFYGELQNAVARLSWEFTPRTRVLDFGCGFGRLTRFFLKDVLHGHLYGVDVVRPFIDICRRDFPTEVMPHDNFSHNEPLPPLEIAAGTFDLITAYSVFTHLKEDVANAWIKEFHRILKPGGLLVITLRQKQYLEYCRWLGRQAPPLRPDYL